LEKKQKNLNRDALVSMQVIDAEGNSVGKVKDVAFAIGKTGISLTVVNDDGETRNIDWEDIQAASDFVILKPVARSTVQPQQVTQTVEQQPQQQPQQQAQQAQPLCPTCNRPLTYIPQYQRWYCYNEKKYV
jgi:sporulation protein YlmC with PRC-barrel domain